MKKVLMMILFVIPLLTYGESKPVDKKYLTGAVPVENGMVVFQKTYEAEGMTKEQIFDSLQVFAYKLTESDEPMPQTRITEIDKAEGTIAISMEEWLYFKNKAWVTDRTRMFYQLLLNANNGKFSITMRRIHYLYEEETNGGQTFNAETWITDDAAIKGNSKLRKANGKFRCKTIDRKDEVFRQAAINVRGVKKVKRLVEEIVEE